MVLSKQRVDPSGFGSTFDLARYPELNEVLQQDAEAIVTEIPLDPSHDFHLFARRPCGARGLTFGLYPLTYRLKLSIALYLCAFWFNPSINRRTHLLRRTTRPLRPNSIQSLDRRRPVEVRKSRVALPDVERSLWVLLSAIAPLGDKILGIGCS